MSTLATPENMRKHDGPGVIAYSPTTGEEYSASPGDYWDRADSVGLTDYVGLPMILVRRRIIMEDVD